MSASVWRNILAVIRRPRRPMLTPSILALQPNSITVARIRGPVPEGWTAVEDSPGMYYRPYVRGDVLRADGSMQQPPGRGKKKRMRLTQQQATATLLLLETLETGPVVIRRPDDA